MAIDRNPRHFFLEVAAVDANVDADATSDYVTIEFAGSVTPTVKRRLAEALEAGEFAIVIKRLV